MESGHPGHLVIEYDNSRKLRNLKIISYFRACLTKYMPMMKYIILFCVCVSLFSCQPKQRGVIPVAKVFEEILYRIDVSEFIPSGTSYEDSVLLAQKYIRTWVTQQLLLHKAIDNLSGEEKDLERQVEDYRTSLLIHQYKQKLIAQRLVDEIPESEIETYYDEHENNFVLPTPIVQALFIILPKNAPHVKEVRKLYKSDKASDQESLEEYCLTNARKYDKFQNKWVEAKFLLNLIPGDFNTLLKEIQTNRHLEKEDKRNYYFLKINAIRKEQTIAPLDYVRDEIVLILKNKKKLEFESELEKQINEEAVRKNYVKIY